MGRRINSMGRRIGYTLLALALSLSLFGCENKKTVELTPQKKEHIESLTRAAVHSKVYEVYGLEPSGILIEQISITDSGTKSSPHTDFTSSGTYSVTDASGEIYSGKFKASGYIEAHGSSFYCDELTPAKNGSTPLPTKAPEPTPEPTSREAAETTVLTLKSDVMLNLSKQYEQDGLQIRVINPEDDSDGCCGAKEIFQAYGNDQLYSVYLYDTREAAENAEKIMFGSDPSSTTVGANVTTRIVEDTVLIAEYKK